MHKDFIQADKFGNKIICRGFLNENNEYTHCKVHLKLLKENRPRLIGYVDVNENTFYCVRDTDKHYHYKTKGFGFNWEFLNGQFVFIDKIHLRVDDNKVYVFPKSLLSQFGTYLNFKQQGFELQKFLQYELIKKYEKTDEENLKFKYEEIIK
jgi:hypothetical protein